MNQYLIHSQFSYFQYNDSMINTCFQSIIGYLMFRNSKYGKIDVVLNYYEIETNVTSTYCIYSLFNRKRVCCCKLCSTRVSCSWTMSWSCQKSRVTENILHYNKCDNNSGMLTHTVLWPSITQRVRISLNTTVLFWIEIGLFMIVAEMWIKRFDL